MAMGGPVKQWNVLLAGGSGLVGQCVTSLLLADARCDRFYSLLRRPAPDGVVRIPLEKLEEELLPPVDVVCIALGTTIKKAGSQEAFRRIDHDLVVSVARRARQSGARRCVLISAAGADASSSIFYNRVKGEAEDSIRDLKFEQTVLLRPSLLLGKREEFRPAETVGRLLSPLISPLLLGPLRRYRPIHAEIVARCMVDTALEEDLHPPLRILESEQMADMVRG